MYYPMYTTNITISICISTSKHFSLITVCFLTLESSNWINIMGGSIILSRSQRAKFVVCTAHHAALGRPATLRLGYNPK
jgi:hypothetical protein